MVLQIPPELTALTPEELIEKIDHVQEKLQKLEEKPAYREYLEASALKEACAELLRARAMEVGNFRSTYFGFQKVEQEKTDWKALCRWLVDMKLVKSKDMEAGITAFTASKSFGKMVQIKEKDFTLKIS